jgi:putative colanic acid biosysnthesis UDP-glucose lipid carrier transferase
MPQSTGKDLKETLNMTSETSFASVFHLQSIPGENKIIFRRYIDSKKAYFISKRILDIFVSLTFIILVLSWLIPLTALLIKLDSRGPIFFKQKRVGRGGRSFYCYKFRTMVMNNDADKKQATEDDQRITKVGKYLRKSNLDEFPQFFNVLIGDMSIVGPRPHMHADCGSFSAIIPGYKFRNLVKPGITGMAQVKGYHGRVITTVCIFRRYQWDAYYIRNASLFLDLRIIFRTAAQRIKFIFLWK